jgi:hypothetical protein
MLPFQIEELQSDDTWRTVTQLLDARRPVAFSSREDAQFWVDREDKSESGRYGRLRVVCKDRRGRASGKPSFPSVSKTETGCVRRRGE